MARNVMPLPKAAKSLSKNLALLGYDLINIDGGGDFAVAPLKGGEALYCGTLDKVTEWTARRVQRDWSAKLKAMSPAKRRMHKACDALTDRLNDAELERLFERAFLATYHAGIEAGMDALAKKIGLPIKRSK